MVSDDPMHQEYRVALGPYVLGHLDDGERAWLEAHLDTCALCSAELQELSPVADLLREASPLAEAPGPDAPPAELGTRIEGAIRGMAADERRRTLTRWTAGLGAGAVAAGLIFVAGMRLAPADDPVAVIPLEHVEVQEVDGSIDADADIVAHTWGVEVKLHGSGFVQGEAYDVSVVSSDGAEHPAGEFVGTGSREMNCNLNSSVLRDTATGFEVRDASGAVVLTSAFSS